MERLVDAPLALGTYAAVREEAVQQVEEQVSGRDGQDQPQRSDLRCAYGLLAVGAEHILPPRSSSSSSSCMSSPLEDQ